LSLVSALPAMTRAQSQLIWLVGRRGLACPTVPLRCAPGLQKRRRPNVQFWQAGSRSQYPSLLNAWLCPEAAVPGPHVISEHTCTASSGSPCGAAQTCVLEAGLHPPTSALPSSSAHARTQASNRLHSCSTHASEDASEHLLSCSAHASGRASEHLHSGSTHASTLSSWMPPYGDRVVQDPRLAAVLMCTRTQQHACTPINTCAHSHTKTTCLRVQAHEHSKHICLLVCTYCTQAQGHGPAHDGVSLVGGFRSPACTAQTGSWICNTAMVCL